MNYEVILSNIHTALDGRYPTGASKNNILRSVLNIDKMGAYRRLNGLVQFKLGEVAELCRALQLPVESLFNIPRSKMISVNLQMTDYAGYGADDHEHLKQSLAIIDRAVESPASRWVLGCNMFPHSILTQYEYLIRFCLCKWKYFNNETGVNVALKDVRLADKLWRIKKEVEAKGMEFSSTVLVWDQKLIVSMLDDIRYFYRINLITDEELENLLAELHRYINYMDSLAARGYHAPTGNEVHVYISSVSLDCNYGFIDSDNVKASSLQAFILNQGWTVDNNSFNYVRSWMNTLIRSSTLISTSGELARVRFFDKQRRMIDDFKR